MQKIWIRQDGFGFFETGRSTASAWTGGTDHDTMYHCIMPESPRAGTGSRNSSIVLLFSGLCEAFSPSLNSFKNICRSANETLTLEWRSLEKELLNYLSLLVLWQNYVKAMRLFVGEPVWTAYNRPADDFPARKQYMKFLADEAQ